MELKAKKASKQELIRRYKLLYPKESEPPPGRYEPNGEIIWDEDGGIERLRERLGSISRFIQELKQCFVFDASAATVRLLISVKNTILFWPCLYSISSIGKIIPGNGKKFRSLIKDKTGKR